MSDELSPQAAVTAWRYLVEGEHDGFTIVKNDAAPPDRVRSELWIGARDVPTAMRVLDQALQHGREREQLEEARHAAAKGGAVRLVHVPEIRGTFEAEPPTLQYAPGQRIALRTVRRDSDEELTAPGTLRYWSVAYDGRLNELDHEGMPLDLGEWDDERVDVDVEPDLRHSGGTLGEVEAWARGAKDALGRGWSYREDLGEATKFREGFEAALDALQSHLDDMRDAR